MFKFFTQRSLGFNILVVLFLIAVVVLLFFGSLDFLTKHDQYEKVPSVLGKNMEAAKKMLEAQGFEVQIQDSIYIDSIPRLAVIKQSPEAGATVKVNRTIYLTVNRILPPLVEMPNLVGFTIRNARMYLENLGLRLGDTSYRPDIAKNAVVEQLFKGEPIKSGQKIFMGSTIDFVLGNGIGDEELAVPSLINKRYSTVEALLKELNLTYTAVIDADVVDTANAFIYRQNPEKYSPGPNNEKRINNIKAGQNIDIYLSIKPAVIDSTETEIPL